MGLLLALLALGGVYYFYSSSSAASGKREGVDASKQIEADASLTSRFLNAVDDFLKDPNTLVVDPKLNVPVTKARLEALWVASDPSNLSGAALEARSFAAEAATKDKTVALVVAKANSIANILQAKIESLTKQGKNLDAAFALIDQGKPLTKASELDFRMIDKAALAPVMFVPNAVSLTAAPEDKPNLLGSFTTLEGAVLGNGEVAQIRDVGRIIDDVTGAQTDLAVGRVVSYSMPAPPEGTYFGEGTHVYIAKKV